MTTREQDRVAAYIMAFNDRHELRKDVWGLDDEIVEGALDYLDTVDYYSNTPCADYDNLAINAEIIAKDSAEADDAAPGEALFETENYYVMSW